VRESRTPGSVRGVPSNGHSYRDTAAVIIKAKGDWYLVAIG
jgi:hypothetical protein